MSLKRKKVLNIAVFLSLAILIAPLVVNAQCCVNFIEHRCEEGALQEDCDAAGLVYYEDSCDQVLDCVTYDQGCCSDTCDDRKQAVLCDDPTSFFPDLNCNDIPSCSAGCCCCVESAGGDFVPNLAMFPATESECVSFCDGYGYLNEAIFAADSVLECENTCTPPVGVDTVDVEGYVIEMVGGEAQYLGGVTVTIIGGASTVTAGDGYYKFSSLIVSETYKLVYSKAGYNELRKDTEIDDSGSLLDVTMVAGAVSGRIFGAVKDSEGGAIPYADVILGGLMSANRAADENGEFEIANLPFGSYTVSASAEDHVLKTEPAMLSEADPEEKIDFVLEKQEYGSFKVIVNAEGAAKQDALVVVKGTSLSCRTDKNGRCTFTKVPVSDEAYTVEASKLPLYAEDTETVTITKTLIPTKTFNLQKQEVCEVKDASGNVIENVLEGRCSFENRPWYCDYGTELVRKCAGPDGVLGRVCNATTSTICATNADCPADEVCVQSDDCGCPQGEECNAATGLCTSALDQCQEDCTYLSDNVCHAECDQQAGCSFNGTELRDFCDLQSSGLLLPLEELGGVYADMSVYCCEGNPFEYTPEGQGLSGSCKDGTDNDGDSAIDCEDDDCQNEQCDAVDPTWRCLPFGDTLECMPDVCASGGAPTVKGCACGNKIADAAGLYCCNIENDTETDNQIGKLYSNSADWQGSPCGPTLCDTNGGICCLGQTCGGSTAGYFVFFNKFEEKVKGDMEDSCDPLATSFTRTATCCQPNGCLDIPAFCCDYEFQCDDDVDTANTCQQAGKVGCNTMCKEISPCHKDLIINSPQGYNYEVCMCEGEAIIVAELLPEDKIRCCQDTTDAYDFDTYVSQAGERCPNEPVLGHVRGVVVRETPEGEGIALAEIYVDGSYIGNADGDGVFDIDYPVGEYLVQGRAEGFNDGENNVYKVLSADDSDPGSLTVILQEKFNPCGTDKLPVDELALSQLPGKPKSIKMEWQDPNCLDAVSIVVERKKTGEADFTEVVRLEPGSEEYIDEVDEYEMEYTYKVYVEYKGNILSATKEDKITSGQEICEDMYDEDRKIFMSFCESPSYRHGRRCDSNNMLIDPPFLDCTELGDTFYCAGPDAAGNLMCKNAAECDLVPQDALPFGLYYEKDNCVGGDKFCYYDSSDAYGLFTSIDRCTQCLAGMTCFDYQSEGACTDDSCLIGSCAWQEFPFSEMGKGFCYEAEYESDDKCSLCGEDGGILSNTGCDQAICSNLGDCFSSVEILECKSCDTAVCEDFTSEQSCTGFVNFTIDAETLLHTLSEDQCNVGRCRWDGQRCFKDGNDDGKSDCEENLKEFLPAYVTEKECKEDTEPPVTILETQSYKISSNSDSPITFTTETPLEGRLLVVCADTEDECLPNTIIPYLEGGVTIDPKELNFEEEGNYFLRYYTIDNAFNQEEIQSKMFTVDLIPPTVAFNYEVDLNVSGSGSNILSDMRINVTIDELGKCKDEIEHTTYGPVQNIFKGTEEGTEWRDASYRLKDGKYYYTMTCWDLAGNEAVIEEEIYIDAYKNIRIISPVGAVKSPVISFEVETDDASLCKLKYASEIKATFASDDQGYTHSTTFTVADQSRYHNLFEVECTDKTDSEIRDVGGFEFALDKIPPVPVMLMESSNIVQESGDDEDYYFNGNVDLNMRCDDPGTGERGIMFGPNVTTKKICVSDTPTGSCEPDTHVLDAEKVKEASRVCFRCEDLGGNVAPVRCINLIIDREPPAVEKIEIFDGATQVDTLIRGTPTKYYDVIVHTSEPIVTEETVLSFLSDDRPFPGEIKLEKVDPIQYKGTMYVPSEFEMFDDLSEVNNSEFVIEAYDLFGNIGDEIKAGKYFTIDTDVPDEPIILGFEVGDVRYTQVSPYYLVGYDADKLADVKAVLEYSTDYDAQYDEISDADEFDTRTNDSGAFEFDVELQKGSNWVQAHTYDYNGNAGEKTKLMKVVYDDTPPEILFVSPGDGSVIPPDGVVISALAADSTAGLRTESTKLTIDGTVYTCLDDLDCEGDKEVVISYYASQMAAATHDAKLEVADNAGNTAELEWQFTVDADAPKAVKVELESGTCYDDERCYTNSTNPVIIVEYDEADSVSVEHLTVAGAQTTVTAAGDNKFKVGVAADAGQHNIKLTSSRTTDTQEVKQGITIISLVVDTTPPEVSIGYEPTTNTAEFDIMGMLDEENIDSIVITGDVTKPVVIDGEGVPSDVVDEEDIFIASIMLEVGDESEANKTIYITIYDKAGNSKTIEKNVYYDRVGPYISVTDVIVSLTKIKKYFEDENKFGVNDPEITVVGEFDKPLRSLEIVTETGLSLVPVYDNDALVFSFDIDLGSVMARYIVESVFITATDLAGNEEIYEFILELDVRTPVAKIIWK